MFRTLFMVAATTATIAMAEPTLQTFKFNNLPTIGTPTSGESIVLGGFSGLAYLGKNPTTNTLRFMTMTDRGPNSEPTPVGPKGHKHRAFLLPAFVPELVSFEIDVKTKQVTITNRLPLLASDGKPMSGLPVRPGDPNSPGHDETGVDLFGNSLPADARGIDPESMVIAEDGTFWLGEEYFPSILHFDAQGKLLERFIPVGSGEADAAVEALPKELLNRVANRGFEGLAISGTKLFVFLQSPFNGENGVGRIIEFDVKTKKTTAQYLYPFEGKGSDKIGDAFVTPKGVLWVIERDDKVGPGAQKRIFSVDLSGATDKIPVKKTLVLDLTKAGLITAEKLEGLAVSDDGVIFVINDNDFGLKVGFDPKSGKLLPHTLTPEASRVFMFE